MHQKPGAGAALRQFGLDDAKRADLILLNPRRRAMPGSAASAAGQSRDRAISR
jgi:hypothetical protein